MRVINKIIIHCAATPEGKDYTVDQIRQWHTTPKPNGNGWKDIGYHFVIYRDGSVHPGRPIEQIGAHTSGYNANSIGICYMGVVPRMAKRPRTHALTSRRLLWSNSSPSCAVGSRTQAFTVTTSLQTRLAPVSMCKRNLAANETYRSHNNDVGNIDVANVVPH